MGIRIKAGIYESSSSFFCFNYINLSLEKWKKKKKNWVDNVMMMNKILCFLFLVSVRAHMCVYKCVHNVLNPIRWVNTRHVEPLSRQWRESLVAEYLQTPFAIS
jgi:hypothetical protein